MRRLFQIVLVVSNLVPLILGTAVAVNGVTFLLPDLEAPTNIAAQVRVYAIWFTGVFFLSVWIALNIETSGPILKIVFCLVALAGASRLLTMVQLGDFPTSTVIGAVVEMATLLFIPWHSHLLRKGATETARSSG